MKIVFTDLDGTLLNSDAKISEKNLLTLKKLSKSGILNVAVTGRNLFSSNKVLATDLPFDYLIFSTGIGTMDFKSRKIINSYKFSDDKTLQVANFLFQSKQNTFIHQAVPNNHLFYYITGAENKDFQQRFELYEKFAIEMDYLNRIGEVSQFVIVLDDNERKYFELKNKIKAEIDNISVIRATSPLNHKNIWLEIYPKFVSKGRAALDLCQKLNTNIKDTMAIGNDYNDCELLKVTGKSYVVKNAPDELKLKYKVVASNNNDGFSEACKIFL